MEEDLLMFSSVFLEKCGNLEIMIEEEVIGEEEIVADSEEEMEVEEVKEGSGDKEEVVSVEEEPLTRISMIPTKNRTVSSPEMRLFVEKLSICEFIND